MFSIDELTRHGRSIAQRTGSFGGNGSGEHQVAGRYPHFAGVLGRSIWFPAAVLLWGCGGWLAAHAVTPATTLTTLGSSANPGAFGQSVTFTATVTGANPGGTVAFNDAGVIIANCGAAAVSGGQAQCTTADLSVGLHAIAAAYAGDANNAPSASAALSQEVANNLPYLQVGTGFFHSCALTGAGGVVCWGQNGEGELGDGGTTSSRTPGTVSGLSSGVTAISVGGYFACALIGGGVKCWGYNGWGSLGDGTTTDSHVPVDVSGLTSGVTAIAAGQSWACALLAGGSVKCWGDNAFGRLGDGTTTSRPVPVAVSGLTSGVTAVAAGANHTCALLAGGALKCWGYNAYGQIGDSSTTSRSVPTPVTGLSSGVQAVAAGGTHTCAVLATGALKCWGANFYAQLGDGTIAGRLEPVAVVGASAGIAAVSAGFYHVCAVTTSAGAKCWGHNNVGQLGDGTSIDRNAPADVSGLAAGVATISAGFSHSCAVTTAGLRCWGDNGMAQLGDGKSSSQPVPATPAGLGSGVTGHAVGWYHGCAVAGGGVQCWGENGFGQVGDGSQIQRFNPVPVQGLSIGVADVAAGSYHTCARTTGGGVKCWGLNVNGQLGDGTTTQRATSGSVSGLGSGAAAITAGYNYTCAVTTGSGALCWGANFSGQLGDGTKTDRYTPVVPSGLGSGVVAVAAGYTHACAIVTGGGVKCWGDNRYGQLGDGTTTARGVPTAVTGLGGQAVAIVAGYWHTCARLAGGTLQCWGQAYGVGDGAFTQRRAPTTVTGMGSDVQSVAAGIDFSCAASAGGSVKCWGSSANYKLGELATMDRASPVSVFGLESGIVALSSGLNHTCARNAGGGLLCWGSNSSGQLGTGGTPGTLARPVVVSTPVKLAIVNVGDGAPPVAGAVFDVQVEAPNAFGVAAPVAVPTTVQLGLIHGSGALGGGTSCTILAGTGGCTIVGVTYPVAETGVIIGASATGGAVLGAGNSNPFNVVAPSTAALGSLVPGAAAVVTLKAVPAVVVGQPVAVSVNVTPPTANGLVNVDDGLATCTIALPATSCNLVPLTAGSKTIVARYGGSDAYAASVSPGQALTVNKAATTTAITADTPSPSVVGTPLTVTVALGIVAPGGGKPTGTIAVGDGAVNCTITLPDSSCLLFPNATGTRTLSATYNGDGNYTGSTAPTVGHPVVAVGGQSALTVTKAGSGAGTVTDNGGFVNCGGNCAHSYPTGSALQLTASAGAGSVFTGWAGACTGLGACNLGLGTDSGVSATFALAGGPLGLDIDRSGKADALTDGLLILRYLAGLQGTPLVQGALAGSATRSDPTVLGQYLIDVRPLLDVDGDGHTDVMTDGLLIIRYLFGLRGNALLAGAVGGGATRLQAGDIEQYIGALLP